MEREMNRYGKRNEELKKIEDRKRKKILKTKD